jgi:RimJ/RimL family protein N-acetyltransferase
MIYGDRIRLRKAEATDLAVFKGWINDPEIRQGISGYLPISDDEEEAWFENQKTLPQDSKTLCLEINEQDKWVLIGNVGLFDINNRARSAEFGIMIGEKAYWNRGLGTEASLLMLKHGFDTLNLHRIYLRVKANNPGARRAYEKAGYVLEGRLREAEYEAGSYVDLELMSVLNHEWRASRADHA